mmetsp:Transcript_12648/g.46711  ORF Transcript_12648/g.46711 Transcript_12648/m.46711 type:complete len:280 (+) Transcript_12648:742-1581(+)|eukprot:scaffold7099_cov281-Pinguiococcus_pyrenoidosus.AAC.28
MLASATDEVALPQSCTAYTRCAGVARSSIPLTVVAFLSCELIAEVVRCGIAITGLGSMWPVSSARVRISSPTWTSAKATCAPLASVTVDEAAKHSPENCNATGRYSEGEASMSTCSQFSSCDVESASRKNRKSTLLTSPKLVTSTKRTSPAWTDAERKPVSSRKELTNSSQVMVSPSKVQSRTRLTIPASSGSILYRNWKSASSLTTWKLAKPNALMVVLQHLPGSTDAVLSSVRKSSRRLCRPRRRLSCSAAAARTLRRSEAMSASCILARDSFPPGW